jgi:hypothetical protein
MKLLFHIEILFGHNGTIAGPHQAPRLLRLMPLMFLLTPIDSFPCCVQGARGCA